MNLSPLSQILSADNSEKENQLKVIQGGQLLFTGKVFVFKDTIYSVKNVSSIEFQDNTKILVKKLPRLYWIILIIGIIFLLMGLNDNNGIFLVLIGFLLIAFSGYSIYNHFQNRVKISEQYGIIIHMNSGLYSVLLSSRKEFIYKVINELFRVLDKEEAEPMIFDFSQNNIEDKSINVKEAVGTALVAGNVVGNVNTQS